MPISSSGENFILVRTMHNLFGLKVFFEDHCLGGENLKMIAIARQFDAAAKFSGSGGAIVGLLTDQSKKTKMKEMFNKNGFVYLGLF